MNQNIFECEIRFLVLLKNCRSALSEYGIVAIDYMATFGADFGISEYNLNGDNVYRDSEFIARKQMAPMAIKDLVLRGLISIEGSDGFKYIISDKGLEAVSKISGAYSEAYSEMTNKVLDRNKNRTETDIVSEINSFVLEGKR